MVKAIRTGWQVYLYDPEIKRKRYMGVWPTEQEARWADRMRIDGRPKKPRALAWNLKSKGETLCRVCGDGAAHLHHLVPRAESVNAERPCPLVAGIPLCFLCHHGWHHRGVTIHREVLLEHEIHFVAATMGEDWLYANYPPKGPVDERAQTALNALHALLDENERLRKRVAELEGDA